MRCSGCNCVARDDDVASENTREKTHGQMTDDV